MSNPKWKPFDPGKHKIKFINEPTTTSAFVEQLDFMRKKIAESTGLPKNYFGGVDWKQNIQSVVQQMNELERMELERRMLEFAKPIIVAEVNKPQPCEYCFGTTYRAVDSHSVTECSHCKEKEDEIQ